MAEGWGEVSIFIKQKGLCHHQACRLGLPAQRRIFIIGCVGVETPTYKLLYYKPTPHPNLLPTGEGKIYSPPLIPGLTRNPLQALSNYENLNQSWICSTLTEFRLSGIAAVGSICSLSGFVHYVHDIRTQIRSSG